MPGFPSIAARQRAASRLARIGRGCRRAASATALLTLMMTAGGCAGLPPIHDRIAAEDHDGKLAQVMRMAESVKAGGDASAAAVFIGAPTPSLRRSSNRWSALPSRRRLSEPT